MVTIKTSITQRDNNCKLYIRVEYKQNIYIETTPKHNLIFQFMSIYVYLFIEIFGVYQKTSIVVLSILLQYTIFTWNDEKLLQIKYRTAIADSFCIAHPVIACVIEPNK